MSLRAFCEWLATTEWSIRLVESLHAYPLIESTHVVSLMLFVGTVTWVDLRLLGWSLQEVPIHECTQRILPWTVAGFAIAFVTGVLLFVAIPVRTYHSIWFRVKVVFLVVAFVNIVLFHRRMQREGPDWDTAPVPPPAVRAAGAISLVSWATVIVMGRMIAYNWFDCDQEPAAWVQWAADCPPVLP